jgi:Flp pilus assembly protein TadB
MKALAILISLFFLGGLATTIGLALSETPNVAFATVIPLCLLGWMAIDTIRRARAERQGKRQAVH